MQSDVLNNNENTPLLMSTIASTSSNVPPTASSSMLLSSSSARHAASQSSSLLPHSSSLLMPSSTSLPSSTSSSSASSIPRRSASTATSPVIPSTSQLQYDLTVPFLNDEVDPWLIGLFNFLIIGICGMLEVILFINVDSYASNLSDSYTRLMVGLKGTSDSTVATETISSSVLSSTMTGCISIAAIFGTMLVPNLYCYCIQYPNSIVFIALLSCALLIGLLAFVTNYILFILMVLWIGIMVGILDPLAQIITRKAQGSRVGLWFGLNSLSYTIFDSSEPVIDWLSSSATWQGIWMSMTILVIVIMYTVYCPSAGEFSSRMSPHDMKYGVSDHLLDVFDDDIDAEIEDIDNLSSDMDQLFVKSEYKDRNSLLHHRPNQQHNRQGQSSTRAVARDLPINLNANISSGGIFGGLWSFMFPLEPGVVVPHYEVEIISGLMLFGIVGIEAVLGGNCYSAGYYLTEYVTETGSVDSSSVSQLNAAYFICMFSSRLAGTIYMQFATTTTLVNTCFTLLLIASLAALSMLIFSSSGFVLWIGLCTVGLCYGAIPPFTLLLLHRMTSPTASSTAVAMLFINSGVSVVLYIVLALWDDTSLGASSIMLILFCVLLGSAGLVVNIERFRYRFVDLEL